MKGKEEWCKDCVIIEAMKKEAITKDKVWKIFSRYIRLRDCLEFTGMLEMGQCVTCMRSFPYSELQAGHFLPGRHNSVLFDERNCHSQCEHCNNLPKGNPVPYRRFMLAVYGQAVIDELEYLDRQPKQLKNYQLLELYEQYSEKVKHLETL